jgi:hypothetical protein
LNRYFASLKPTATDPFLKPPPLQPFNSHDFLTHVSGPLASVAAGSFLQLHEHDTPLRFRRSKLPGTSSSNASHARAYYKQWLSSPSFASWLHARVDTIDDVSNRRYLSTLRMFRV